MARIGDLMQWLGYSNYPQCRSSSALAVLEILSSRVPKHFRFLATPRHSPRLQVPTVRLASLRIVVKNQVRTLACLRRRKIN